MVPVSGRSALPVRVFASLVALLAALAGLAGTPARAETRVDVELVLAVDISYSMDEDEQRLQRAGYVEAITSPEVLEAIRRGPNQRIAVAYVEWAGAAEQRLTVDWTLIDGKAAAEAFVAKLMAQPIRRAYRTSISGALGFSAPLFDRNGYDGLRQVIDVSGDGPNNQGLPVEEVRREVLDRGIVINGLPILIKRPNFGTMDITDLDTYYGECVVGGEGSFMVPIKTREAFLAATRMKLLMEIAGDFPPATPASREPRIVPAAEKLNPLCLVGERLWQERQDWMRN
ncbi:DUF1194 domain-containing protein [Prosthecodimorpha staleyi]|uniref:DUF1194 domain-containing protein n=1 Tax=Prosthecodimorpha staleyi TaxID=2840188 RepID=A0A947D570_9HYPH|nr:DUF1194 domain-containing protein [Prosthecodimorpha staleyi]